MNFKTFLNESTSTCDVSTSNMLCEKVDKQINALMKPYTKELCTYLAKNCGIDPQAPTTKFNKFSDEVVDEMLHSSRIFNLFKRAALIDNYAEPGSNGDKTAKNKKGIVFVACAHGKGKCTGLAAFKFSDKERYVEVSRALGPSCARYAFETVKLNVLFDTLCDWGDVSVFAVTSSYEDSLKLDKILHDRMNIRASTNIMARNFSKANSTGIVKDRDLADFRGAKAVEKLTSKLPDHVDNLIDNFGDDPVTADYGGVAENVRYIGKILQKLTKLERKRDWYNSLEHDVDDMINSYSGLKNNPLIYTDDSVNESIPNNVRKLFNLSGDWDRGIYGDLHNVGISAEHADYTILDSETDRFNKAPGKINFHWYVDDDPEPVRITMLKKWLNKYDALILIHSRNHAIVTRSDRRRGIEIEGSESVISDRVFSIVGVNGGSLKDVYAAKNAKRMGRRGKAYDTVIQLLIDLRDQLRDIDFKKDIFYNRHSKIDNAISTCDDIISTCKDVVNVEDRYN